MIVFSADSGLSSFEKTVVAARYQVALTAVYANQLEGGQTIEVWPLISPNMSYTAANKSAVNAIQWMISQNGNVTSPLRIARELLGNPGADLVLMVVPDTTSPVCGYATDVPLVASSSRSESAAFAIVVLEDNDPDCLEEITVPHEIGHLLYAEHETDVNGDDLLPSYSNHATQSSMSSLVSLMWGGFLDSNNTEFLSGFLASMTSAWADNVEFMTSTSFDVVSRYRAPPPTVFCYSPPLFLGCPPGCMSSPYLMQWGGQNASSFVVQKLGFTGWSNWYSGTNTSSFASTGTIFDEYFKVKAINASGASSDWCHMTLYVQCSEEMDPW
jgi:hypothetical protein